MLLKNQKQQNISSISILTNVIAVHFVQSKTPVEPGGKNCRKASVIEELQDGKNS